MEINEVLEVREEKHEELGRTILVTAKRFEDGGIPFLVECENVDVNDEVQTVTIRLSEATAAKLAHHLMKTVAEPQDEE